MARAEKNDLCEIFGYAPDDTSVASRKQWKSRLCPFVGGTCIKHSHPRAGEKAPTIYGTCSVSNKLKDGTLEEVILCPQRLYANSYQSLKSCISDAFGKELPVVLANDAKGISKAKSTLSDYVIIFGQRSGGEVSLSGSVELSLDWVFVRIVDGSVNCAIPCEVQSIDTTGNYHANWKAYSQEKGRIPNSSHGMNWANAWKRLIPQILLKGAIASNSTLCNHGTYFVLPERVYQQFEKLIGPVPTPSPDVAQKGSLTVMAYDLGPEVPFGQIRGLIKTRTSRMMLTDFAEAFASGRQLLPLGEQLDKKVFERIASVLGS
jgi:hypothetical protein